MHCHNVKETQWAEEKATGTWQREQLWTYPLPENIGLVLENERGNMVKSVTPKSVAERAGMKVGDRLKLLNGYTVYSFADAQYALHKAPVTGKIKVSWAREGYVYTTSLTLEKNWRKTNITWRPSLLGFLPSLPLYGTDLTLAEKQQLGLNGKQLAFRQETPIHDQAKEAGVRENDVIVGIDHVLCEMKMEDFLGYVRINHLIGDRITLNLIRAGKKLDLPMTLR